MPLEGSESTLARALHAAAVGSAGDPVEAWKRVAAAILDHIAANALVTGSTPNGGPLVDGKIT